MELSPPRAESELRVAADVAAIRFGGKGRWKTIATYNNANATDRFHSIEERSFFWKRGKRCDARDLASSARFDVSRFLYWLSSHVCHWMMIREDMKNNLIFLFFFFFFLFWQNWYEKNDDNLEYFFFYSFFDSELKNLWLFFKYSWIISLK